MFAQVSGLGVSKTKQPRYSVSSGILEDISQQLLMTRFQSSACTITRRYSSGHLNFQSPHLWLYSRTMSGR